ncbi:MAG: hypothetical protein LBU27_09175 [Candidatus Peribacteria bacterium]|nr:hypothetical protein [Candidatus Peribacteria bacterium]
MQEAPKADGANQGKNAGDEWEEYSFDEMKEMLVEGGLNPPEEITEKEPLVARCVQQHITLTQ